jgi:hypothetical protein
MQSSDASLHDLLLQLSPSARDKLRRVLILDQPDRGAITSELLRYGDANGDGWADVTDTLTMYPDVRRNSAPRPTDLQAHLLGCKHAPKRAGSRTPA